MPVAELTAAAAEDRHAWDRRTMDPAARLEARDAAFERAWGEFTELNLPRAVTKAWELSPRLLRHASQAGMLQDARIWLRLVEQWERQYR